MLQQLKLWLDFRCENLLKEFANEVLLDLDLISSLHYVTYSDYFKKLFRSQLTWTMWMFSTPVLASIRGSKSSSGLKLSCQLILSVNFKNHNFEPHYGILSIGNFIPMIKNHSLLFQLPDNWPKTKKYAPYFCGDTEFPMYLTYP
jgi:hypothetical protein